jgi:hypothetical protein
MSGTVIPCLQCAIMACTRTNFPLPLANKSEVGTVKGWGRLTYIVLGLCGKHWQLLLINMMFCVQFCNAAN